MNQRGSLGGNHLVDMLLIASEPLCTGYFSTLLANSNSIER